MRSKSRQFCWPQPTRSSSSFLFGGMISIAIGILAFGFWYLEFLSDSRIFYSMIQGMVVRPFHYSENRALIKIWFSKLEVLIRLLIPGHSLALLHVGW